MTAYALDGLNSLGIVTKETQEKSCNLFYMPMPGSDSSSAILIDLFGSSRDITIEGVYPSSDTTYSIANFIIALDALVNGSQTIQHFTSGKSGVQYHVLIDSVSWEAEEGNVSAVKYTIRMKEGSV